MTCTICHTDKANIEPKTDNFPICVDCVDDKVIEIAERRAKEMPVMVRSTRRTSITTHTPVEDLTPEQVNPDSRCDHCASGRWHSQWAHEDAVSDYLEEEEIAELRAEYCDEESNTAAWFEMNCGE